MFLLPMDYYCFGLVLPFLRYILSLSFFLAPCDPPKLLSHLTGRSPTSWISSAQPFSFQLRPSHANPPVYICTKNNCSKSLKEWSEKWWPFNNWGHFWGQALSRSLSFPLYFIYCNCPLVLQHRTTKKKVFQVFLLNLPGVQMTLFALLLLCITSEWIFPVAESQSLAFSESANIEPNFLARDAAEILIKHTAKTRWKV